MLDTTGGNRGSAQARKPVRFSTHLLGLMLGCVMPLVVLVIGVTF